MFAIYGTSGQMFRGPFEELRQVVPTLRTSPIRRLDPVVDRPAGVITAVSGDGSAKAQLPQAGQAVHAYEGVQKPAPVRHPLSRVADIMSRELRFVRTTATVWDALQYLSAQRVGQAPVISEQGALVGLFTWVQLFNQEHLPGPQTSALVWRAQLQQPVTAWMISPVPSVEPDTDIRRLAMALLETGLSGLPVVENGGAVAGFVSRTDVLRAVTHDPPLDLWT